MLQWIPQPWIFILGVILTLIFLLGIHEFGHFIVAKLCGIKVLRFSVGFGKPLVQWKDSSGTEYRICIFPLIGYVKWLDEAEAPVSEADRPFIFKRQPLFKRFAVILGGASLNLLFALLVYFALFSMGITHPIPTIGRVIPDSPAAHSGLHSGLEILSLGGNKTQDWGMANVAFIKRIGSSDSLPVATKDPKTQQQKTYYITMKGWKLTQNTADFLEAIGLQPESIIPGTTIATIINPNLKTSIHPGDQILAINHQTVHNWQEMRQNIQAHPNGKVTLTIKHKKIQKDVSIVLESRRNGWLQKIGYLGVTPSIEFLKGQLRTQQYSGWNSIKHASSEVWQYFAISFIFAAKLITGDIPLHCLAGPLSLFVGTFFMMSLGWLIFLEFLAFISISLAAFNLLPLPGFDGGWFIFTVIEGIMGKPIPVRVQALIGRLGFILAMLLLIQMILNDIVRFF